MARIGPPTTIAYLDDGHPESRDCADNYRAVTGQADQQHLLGRRIRAAAESADLRRNVDAPANPAEPRR
jgi:hypothetical protein